MVSDVQTCLAQNPQLEIDEVQGLIDAVNAGKIEWNGSAELACVSAEIVAVDCAEQARRLTAVAACADGLRGTVGAGAACELDAECISQSCDIPACSGVGRCVGSTAPSYPTLGEPCQDACLDSACEFGTCVALAAIGSACNDTQECPDTATCVGAGSGSNGICTALPTAGEPCGGDGCQNRNLDCIFGSGSGSGTCVALGLAGAACDNDHPCSPFYACNNVGTCGPLAPIGGACESSRDCAQRGGCYQNVCVGPEPNGSACLDPSDCASNSCGDRGSDYATCIADPDCY